MEYVKLGDICEIINGYAFKSKNYVTSGIRIIRITNVQKGFVEDTSPVYYPLSTKNDFKKYILYSEDLLISLTGNVGRVAILDKKYLPAFLNQRVACIRLKSNKVLKEYLFYMLNTNIFEIKSINSSKGIAQKNISTEWLKNYLVPLPNLEIQQHIVTILNKLRRAIKNKERELNELDELIKARFVEMFGDPSLNEKGYSIVKFSEFAKIDTKSTRDYEKYADYPHIGIENIEKNTGRLVNYQSVRKDKIKSSKYLFTSHHVIYSKLRPNLNKVAVPNFNGLCSSDAYPILPNADICNRIYLAYLMRSGWFLNYIVPMSTGTNLPRVSKNIINNFKWPLAPLSLQNKFANFVQQVDKSKFENIVYLNKTLSSKILSQLGDAIRD